MKLNPKLWRGEDLSEQVSSKLKDIAIFSIKKMGVPISSVKDVVVTGSNAGFLYSTHSDIDLHIVIDKDQLDVGDEMVDDYFRMGKKLMGYENEFLIYGIPVEIYFEDIDDKHAPCSGRYSLTSKKWLQKPCDVKVEYSLEYHTKLREYVYRIRDIIENGVGNKYTILNLKSRLTRMRRVGLTRSGESSVENLVYRNLRDRGLLSALDKYLQKDINTQLSLQ